MIYISVVCHTDVISFATVDVDAQTHASARHCHSLFIVSTVA